jgi:hypothetical protein
MHMFQQIKAEVEDNHGTRRRLITRALHAIRRFISLRHGLGAPPARHESTELDD